MGAGALRAGVEDEGIAAQGPRVRDEPVAGGRPAPDAREPVGGDEGGAELQHHGETAGHVEVGFGEGDF